MTYTKVIAFCAVGSGREGKACDVEKHFFFVSNIYPNTASAGAECTVYSKLLVDSPEVND